MLKSNSSKAALLIFLGLYAGSVAILWRNKEFAREEAIFMFVLFGVIFPGVAWIATLRAPRLAITFSPKRGEMWVLGIYFVALSIYLIGGPQLIHALLPAAWIDSERVALVSKLIKKLIVFVGIPYLLFRCLFGYAWKDFGISRESLRQLGRGNFSSVMRSPPSSSA